MPIANMDMAPPKVTNPFPICSQDIPDIFSKDDSKIVIEDDTINRPIPILIILFGIKFTAKVIAANEPAIANNPLPIEFISKVDISFNAKANILIEPPINAKAIPDDIILLAFFVKFENSAISARRLPIAESPFPISSQLISLKSLHDDVRIFKAAARITILTAILIGASPNLTLFKNNSISPIKEPTPAMPLPNSSQLRLDKSSQTDANNFRAIAIMIICPAPLITSLLSLAIIFAEAIIVAVNETTPSNPIPNCSIFNDATFFKADANMLTAMEIPIIKVKASITLLYSPFILSNTANEPNKSAIRTVTAPRDADNLTGSINDKVNMAADNIATATAS